jgi:hypothetical protein
VASFADASKEDGIDGFGQFVLESLVKTVVLVPLSKRFFVAAFGLSDEGLCGSVQGSEAR